MGGKKSEIDTEEVKKVINALKKNRAKFEEGKGTSAELGQKGNITTQDLGVYPAGLALGASTVAAYNQISGQYQEFINSYDEMIDALQRMVANHDEKEQTNVFAAKRVTSGGRSSSTRRTTEEWGGS
ncbi:hypothetical protein ACFOY4_42885 [Actinomadura syzygii]|uniref:Uncharacterized protein n=1 Tax=Actinomadura syzygii TaxID=1427538 RepID=A0A5D0TNW4_9ACTN|nr:hypothetical protein [Actinomadura syzygii]TYC07818.1 hypothetical protein FXF65_40445 [Actinomadura syzygii]